MQLTRTLFVLGALAFPALAQDDSSCDPQNDDNNDATCMSKMAAATGMNVTQTQSHATASTDANGRVTSYVQYSTITGPALVFTTNLVSETVISTNPNFTSTITGKNTYTLVNTDVYTQVYISTGRDGSATTITSSATVSGTPGAVNNNGKTNTRSTGTSSGMAAATNTAKYIPAAGLTAVLGLAAAL